jgi:hypothetical protein
LTILPIYITSQGVAVQHVVEALRVVYVLKVHEADFLARVTALNANLRDHLVACDNCVGDVAIVPAEVVECLVGQHL